MSEAVRLEQMAARFAPTEIKVDLAKVSAADRKVLAKLVEASKIMDAIFLRQVWALNEPMLIDLADGLCTSTFGPDVFAACTQLAYSEAGQPYRYMAERKTRN